MASKWDISPRSSHFSNFPAESTAGGEREDYAREHLLALPRGLCQRAKCRADDLPADAGRVMIG